MAEPRSKSTSNTKFDQVAVVESNLDIALILNTTVNVVVTLNFLYQKDIWICQIKILFRRIKFQPSEWYREQQNLKYNFGGNNTSYPTGSTNDFLLFNHFIVSVFV